MNIAPLIENKEVRQRPEEGFRRWFVNARFDLIFWYVREQGDLIGFQLCWGKNEPMERAFTWSAQSDSYRQGFQSTHKVTSSRGALHSPATAILHDDGGEVPLQALENLKKEQGDLPDELLALVIEKTFSYNRRRTAS